jgi:cobyrinic acid a,c-diamide synthase
MQVRVPRIVVAGLSGDSGKTTISLAILNSLKDRGFSVSAFKKGPDYIDAAWLSAVSGAHCRNLDTYMAGPGTARARFASSVQEADIAIVEGNRGLFDGKDLAGTHSTAELAKLLQAPVVLVVDVTKSTRTIAALVKGCMDFDSDVVIGGVVLSRVAGPRHESIVSGSIEDICGIPVLGSVPKLGDDASVIPGRHLGLIPPAEYAYESELADVLGRVASYIDIEAVIGVARTASCFACEVPEVSQPSIRDVRIGYFCDSVFTFYYPENLEALETAGAELVKVSSLNDTRLPELDALYIGGGFPETQASRLSANSDMLGSVKGAAVDGMPIYAECGGLIYLCRSLEWNGESYDMSNVFPIDLTVRPEPAGHGYVEFVADKENPYFGRGVVVRGHEFHYSTPVSRVHANDTCLSVRIGTGLGSSRDGLLSESVFAAYCHVHADGARGWADKFVAAARAWKTRSQAEDYKSNPGAADVESDSSQRSSMLAANTEGAR